MPRTTRIAGRSESHRNARARSESGHELEDWPIRGEVADLFDIEPGVAVALVALSIGVPLQIGEPQPRPVRRPPHLLLLVKTQPSGV
jgi:hypothetical protein